MGLMNRFVDSRLMNEAVDVVHDNLAKEDAEYDISNDLCEAGQCGVESMCGWSTGQCIKRNYAQLHSGCKHLIPEYDKEALPDLRRSWLLLIFLQFMAGRECREKGWERNIDRRCEPEAGQLYGVSSEERDSRW
jgi:hypothetical protein